MEKRIYTEIEYDKELSFYFFKEVDADGNEIEKFENYNKDTLKELRNDLIKSQSPKKKRTENKKEIDAIDSMMEDLVGSFEDTMSVENKANTELPERQSSVETFNFKENKNKSETQASNLLKSLLKFYLTEEYISENDYIKAKIGIDQLTLSGLINQLKLSENAIEKLMESISNGESHPRMFEVLAGMQRVYIDLLKTQSLSIIAAEEHMKKLKDDFDYYQSNTINVNSNQKQITEESDTTTVRGTRDFLKSLEDQDEDDEE